MGPLAVQMRRLQGAYQKSVLRGLYKWVFVRARSILFVPKRWNWFFVIKNQKIVHEDKRWDTM